MKSIPKIQKYMTTVPHAINSESTIEEALKLMEKSKIRHLPVIKGGKVFGLVSERDIKQAASFASVNPKTTRIADICEESPYETSPNASVDEVAKVMSQNRYGSALVLDNGKLVGIFTTTDALDALSDICQQKYHS